MKKINIIDREDTCNHLSKILNDNSQDGFILFVHGKPGIGKTFALRKAINSYSTSKTKIYVNTSLDTIKNPTLVSLLANQLDKEALKFNLLNLEKFKMLYNIKNLIKISLRPSYVTIGLEPIIETIFDFIRKHGGFDGIDEKIAIEYGFIKYIMLERKNHYVIVFENIDNISQISNDYITDIIRDIPQSYIFEIRNFDKNQIVDLITYLDIIYHEYEVTEIDKDHLMKIVEDQNVSKTSFLEEYSEENGFFRIMLKFRSQTTIKNSINVDDEYFLDLDIIDKTILYILSINDLSVSKRMLFKISKMINLEYTKKVVESSMDKLLEKDLLRMNNNLITTKYRILDEQKQNPVRMIVLQTIAKIYRKKAKKNEKYYLKLLDIYSEISPKEFRNIALMLSKSKNQDYLSNEKIKVVENDLMNNPAHSNEEKEKHKFLLVKLYYHNGSFYDAYRLIQTVNIDNDLKVAYKAILLNRVRLYEDSISYCIDEISKTTNSRLKTVLNIINIINYGRIRDYVSCEKIFKEELINSNKNTIEYGSLLKNSEIFMPMDKAIHYVKLSKKMFLDNNQYGEALQTLSVLQSWNEEHLKSKFNFYLAKRKLDNSFKNHFYNINNKIAISINSGKCKSKYLVLLNNLLRLTTDDFDRLSVLGNMIICHKLLKSSLYIDKVINDALDIISEEKETDTLIAVIVLKQISFYYNGIDNNKMDEIDNMINEILSTVKDLALHEREFKEITNKRGYIVNFLTTWNFEIPDDI